ncbi:MAG TPA: hypothetical protein VNJ51_11625, partial [Candidatus Dormibacteraeota bacterium]|nr:hypothetical protein [Candidatus Dormibacteraeota bacterium]
MGTGVPLGARAYAAARAVGPGILSFALIFVAWYALTASGLVKPISMASPAAVGAVLIGGLRDGSLWPNIAASLERLVLSVSVAGALGIACGVLVGISRRLAAFVEPLAGFFNAVSGIVWLPLAITWFGLDWKTVLFVIGNTVFFILFFNTLVGVRAVPSVYEQAVT